jgi:hypothetical protein
VRRAQKCESGVVTKRLAQPLRGELDGLRREVTPGLEIGLELLLRVSLKIFPYRAPGGRALPLGNFSRINGSLGMGAIEARSGRVGNHFDIEAFY